MSKTILAFVGMMGSGKGTAVSYFTALGYPSVYFGGFVYEEVEARGLDRVKDEMMVRQDMRDKEGPTVMAKRAAQRANQYFEDGAQAVIFDGLYSWDEYLYLKEAFGDTIKVVALVTDRARRHQRVLERKDGRNYTSEEIVARETNEVEKLNKGGPIAMADHYVHNNGSVDELNAQLAELNQRLLENDKD